MVLTSGGLCTKKQVNDHDPRLSCKRAELYTHSIGVFLLSLNPFRAETCEKVKPLNYIIVYAHTWFHNYKAQIFLLIK